MDIVGWDATTFIVQVALFQAKSKNSMLYSFAFLKS
jgi:hypothetical protein